MNDMLADVVNTIVDNITKIRRLLIPMRILIRLMKRMKTIVCVARRLMNARCIRSHNAWSIIMGKTYSKCKH